MAPARTRFFEIYVYNALILVAAGLCLARAAAGDRERAAWLVLGAGLLAWAAGEAYYSIFLDELSSPPAPSVSDGLWLAFFPACYVAIVLLVRERVRQFRSSLWLDGVVGALAASAIAAALIFGTVVEGGENSSVIAVDLAYAIGDLVLLGFVVAVFGLTGWRPGRRAAPGGRGARDERNRRRLVPLQPRHRGDGRHDAGRLALARVGAADRLCRLAAADRGRSRSGSRAGACC